MELRQAASLPARPAGLPEWEDLLVRYEIMARALRVTLEEVDRQPGAAAETLRRMVRREAEFSGWLARARGDAEPGPTGPGAEEQTDPAALADRFASLRARNFAMLQRRGVDVWEWSGPLAGAGTVTAHQLVSALVGSDAVALAELRRGLRLGVAAC